MEELRDGFKLAKWISEEILGIISEEDRKELFAWLEAHEDNKQEYERILQQLKTEIQRKPRVEVDQEWVIFKESTLPKRRIFAWWQVAAAAALAGVLWVWFAPEKSPVQEEAKLNHPTEIIKEKKAILVLEDGTQVSLSEGKDSVLISSDGLRVATSGNGLEYAQDRPPSAHHVRYNKLIIPRGAEYELHLADGTRVWLNSESSIRYPVDFSGDKREVSTEGELCFEVAKNEKQPFMVSSGGVSVRVLGTKFNLEAYPGHPVITTLVAGKVEVSDGRHTQVISPDQQVVISSRQFLVRKVYGEDYVQWTNGIFSFTDSSLGTIMERLARWYNVDVVFANPNARNARFSLEVQRTDHISSILSKIEMTGRVKFNVLGRKVIVNE